MLGKLYLIPTLLGDTAIERSIPEYNLRIIKGLKYFIVENLKQARAFLKKAGVKPPFDNIYFFELNKHTSERDVSKMMQSLIKGNDFGIMTDAGFPVVADPGENIIRFAHENNIQVIPLSGPSSILLALAASGLNAESFTFHGYLPINSNLRVKTIKEIEKTALKTGYSQIFIETPYRNTQLLKDILKVCKAKTQLSIAANISTSNEEILTLSIEEWKKQNKSFHKIPAVFVIGTA
ncbi:MAG: SAM-dependent methyltransferase [Bacteroidota bacterium]|nr:SAM-dependent methyltransferase [Bacteroidota bacterium]